VRRWLLAVALAGCAHRPADPEAHQRRAERRARIGAAIKAGGDALPTPHETICTSTRYGATVYTNCSER